jgi:hypothetical protein
LENDIGVRWGPLFEKAPPIPPKNISETQKLRFGFLFFGVVTSSQKNSKKILQYQKKCGILTLYKNAIIGENQSVKGRYT